MVQTKIFFFFFLRNVNLYIKKIADKHNQLTLYHKIQLLKMLEKKILKAMWGKEENAGHQHFLLFPQWFLQSQRKITCFEK